MKGNKKIYVTIKVHPCARKRGIEKMDSGEYRIHVLAPPSKGEANREVVETLASHFGLPSSRVKIVRGLKSRQKFVVLDLDEE